MSVPKLLLIAKDHISYNHLKQQISIFFKGQIAVSSAWESDDYDAFDLIAVTHPVLLKEHPAIPQDKVLTLRRAVNITRLVELMKLPPDSKCLVVNNFKEMAQETIEILTSFAFEFDMIPYYPGCESEDLEGIDVVITPFEIELPPLKEPLTINIGIRPIALSSFFEISFRLGISMNDVNRFTNSHVSEVLEVVKGLSQSLNRVQQLNSQLDAILDTVHDGIIATDINGNLLEVNKAAKKILNIHMPDEEMIGKPLAEIFPKFRFDHHSDKENMLMNLNGINLVVNNKSIENDKHEVGRVTAFQDVTQIQHLEHEIRKGFQAKGLSAKYTINDIIGQSSKIKETLRIMEKIAKTDRTVLILGENGTGKELFAHSIHQLSTRRNGPFLPVNFAGLPESLAESELFGYEEGTFTGGAKGGKLGLFELAHNGTLFLDEIGDASPGLQANLLRVLQERQVMRVGGRSLIPVNVRIIAATNQNLQELVAKGKFREDLYYRLFVLPLRIPSLRERREDIPELVHYFLTEYHPTKVKLMDEVMEKLITYHWPGNVRELVSVVQYIVSVMDDVCITVDDLPEQFKQQDDGQVELDTNYINTLEKYGDLLDFTTILSCLHEAQMRQDTIGRGKIVQYARQAGHPLSDQQVRRRMEVLRELELIRTGTRGQGSRITQLGIYVLELIRQKEHE